MRASVICGICGGGAGRSKTAAQARRNDSNSGLAAKRSQSIEGAAGFGIHRICASTNRGATESAHTAAKLQSIASILSRAVAPAKKIVKCRFVAVVIRPPKPIVSCAFCAAAKSSARTFGGGESATKSRAVRFALTRFRTQRSARRRTRRRRSRHRRRLDLIQRVDSRSSRGRGAKARRPVFFASVGEPHARVSAGDFALAQNIEFADESRRFESDAPRNARDLRGGAGGDFALARRRINLNRRRRESGGATMRFESGDEAVEVGAREGDSGGARVAAERGEQGGRFAVDGGERAMQIESRRRAPRSFDLPVAAVGENESRSAAAIGQSPRRQADDAGVPRFVEQREAGGGGVFLRARQNLRGRFFLQYLALFVGGIERARRFARGFNIGREQAAQSGVGAADATGGVDSRRDGHAHIDRPGARGIASRYCKQRVDSRPSRAFADSVDSVSDQRAINANRAARNRRRCRARRGLANPPD